MSAQNAKDRHPIKRLRYPKPNLGLLREFRIADTGDTPVRKRSDVRKALEEPLKNLSLDSGQIGPNLFKQVYRVGREQQAVQKEILRQLGFRVLPRQLCGYGLPIGEAGAMFRQGLRI